jgi:glycosyltransferase involved in cell wall biosynthesis
MNVGRTSPGIVFEKLIRGLSRIHEVDLITSDYDPSIDLSTVKNVIEIKRRFRHPRIYKFLISIFTIDPRDWLWAKKGIRQLRRKNKKRYDLVFCFLSFHHYAPLVTGVLYIKKHSSKLAVYTVDAIPAPLGWSKNDFYFKAVKKMMATYLQKADFLFSGNHQMLHYQLETFRSKENLIAEVIYNPILSSFENYDIVEPGNYMFLYTGGLYGLRTPKYVLAAFKKILKEFPNSTLEFVGSFIPEEAFKDFSFEERKKVIIHPFMRNLKEFYERATALIDIDADLHNDIYLSGKISNYLTINRMIICITGILSPSRKIFEGIDSIIQCSHDVGEVTVAMRKAIRYQGEIKIKDRENVLKIFQLESIINQLNVSLNN